MNFYSIQFFTFLVIALICYYKLFRRKQWICLLGISAAFYWFTGIENFLFLLLTGFTTWAGAKKLAAYSKEISELRSNKALDKDKKKERKEAIGKKRRTVMWGVLLVNFGVLAVLKYLEPFLQGVGVIGEDHPLGLVLPLGISFYTFQSIGYLLDIYYDKYDAEANFAKYMLFVSYFPQLIQGPINRFETLGPQLVTKHKWDDKSAVKALYRMFYGFFKKYAIANIFAVVIANTFDTPARDFAGITVIFSILLYSAQQYADFSGGIDIVLGISELFGIYMDENFRQPYFSVSLADFWRRWHITLGKWMRDYVFYPFALTAPMKKFGKWANKKCGKHLGRVLPPAIGNLLVFFIVGIWHGAEAHYIVWGLYNGAVIALSDILQPVYDKMVLIFHVNRKAKWYHVFQMVRTFVVVNIGWYFDRIVNVREAFYSLKKSVFQLAPSMIKEEYSIVFDGIKPFGVQIALVSCVFVFIVSVMKEKKVDVREYLYKCPMILRWGIYTVILLMTVFASTRVGDVVGGFMYANF